MFKGKRVKKTAAKDFVLAIPERAYSQEDSSIPIRSLRMEMLRLHVQLLEVFQVSDDPEHVSMSVSDFFLIQDVCGRIFYNKIEVREFLRMSGLLGGIFARIAIATYDKRGRSIVHTTAIYARTERDIYLNALDRAKARMQINTDQVIGKQEVINDDNKEHTE